MKTIDQIYRPNNLNNEKYYSDKRKPLGDLIGGNKNSQFSHNNHNNHNNVKMY